MTHVRTTASTSCPTLSYKECLPEEWCDNVTTPGTPVCAKCPAMCAKCSNATTCTLCSRFSTGWKDPTSNTSSCTCNYY